MSDIGTQVFYASLATAAAIVGVPLMGELVVAPAYSLGWSTAEAVTLWVSNGFLF